MLKKDAHPAHSHLGGLPTIFNWEALAFNKTKFLTLPVLVLEIRMLHTVPFRIVRPSRVTGPVDMDEIGHLSWVTAKVADA